MLSHIFVSENTNSVHASHDYGVEQILNKNVPQFIEKNPLHTAKFLASFLKNTIEQDTEYGSSHDLSHRLVNAIEDHEQNNYFMPSVGRTCTVHLRNCLVRLGHMEPTDLQANMKMLEEEFYIFKRLKIFLYDRFPHLFKDKIEKALVDFFDVSQIHHEYYNLLRNTFGKIDETIQNQIMDLIRAGSREIFDKYKKKDDEYANKMKKSYMLRKLEPVHDYLKGEDKKLYEKLVHEFGMPSHPDFVTRVEIIYGNSSLESGLFYGKTVDDVFDMVKKYR